MTHHKIHQAFTAMSNDRVSSDPDVMFGKPVIKGTRVPVEHILRKLGDGRSVAEIMDDHPHLTEADVYAAARFAADYMANEEVVPVGGNAS